MTKRCTLAEAIDRHVTDGASVYLAGFTHLIDFAAAHEIIRQRRQDLVLIRMTPDVVYDQMVAAGCASRLVFSYLGNPGLGSVHAIRRAIESGAIAWTEYTHGSLIAALRAGAQRLPFALAPALAGTDLPRHNPEVAWVTSPYDGRRVTVVPPLRPDVAVVHVQRADASGNCQVWGQPGELREAAFAARAVIVTAEEIVDEAVIRSDPSRTLIPGAIVDAVVHEPWAGHPSHVQGHYARDNRAYREWAALSRSPEAVDEYVHEWVHELPSRAAYVGRLGARVAELARIGDAPGQPVNYGENAAIAAVQD